MAQPFNYGLGVQSPMEAQQAAYQGQLKTLATEAEMQRAMAQTIAERQRAQQAAELEARKQAAFERLRQPDVTALDYQAAALLGNKDQAELIMKFASMADAEQKRAMLGKVWPVAAALSANRPDRAIANLEQQREALKDNPAALAEIDRTIQSIKASPEDTFAELAGYVSFVDQNALDGLLKISREGRDRREAERVKLSPAIQEAIDFRNLSPDDKQTFLSLKTLSRPPAAVTNVNVTNLDKSAATQLGELVPKLHDQANSAVAQLHQIPRYRQALNSAITGPLAETRLNAARVASSLGFTGDKAVAATTELMQGMAEMTLQSRSLLTGQGSLSNFEQMLLTRARSGELNYTKPELNTLFNVFDRAARAQYNKSKNLLQSAASKSETAAMFLQNVSELPAEQPSPNASRVNALLDKYGPK